MIVGQPWFPMFPVIVGENAMGRRMPRIGPEDLLGPLEPFVLVAVFHHPLGNLESCTHVLRVFQDHVPELNNLVVLLAQPRRDFELSPRLDMIARHLERLSIRITNLVVVALDLAQEFESLTGLLNPPQPQVNLAKLLEYLRVAQD